jgi:outer membrane receptor protein involved in Fe transport
MSLDFGCGKTSLSIREKMMSRSMRLIFEGEKPAVSKAHYIQDKIQITRDLTVNLGLRYDHYNIVTSGQSFSPRLNLAYALNKHRTVLHFAYNRFFAPPSIENLLLSAHLGFDGSPPQISRSNFFEGGASQSITDKFVLRMTAFWRSDKNSFENTELANVHVFAPTTVCERQRLRP